MMTFTEIKESIKGINKKVDHYSAILNSFPKDEMGLIFDIYKKTHEYTEANNQFNFWFKQLQEANKYKVKNFKKELNEERKNRMK